MFGQMEENTRVNGSIIKCMAMEYINGEMAEDIKASINMIKSMDQASILGLTVANIMEIGQTAKDTDKVE